MAESALIVPVPEAEPLVASLRARFDPTASRGVPAHITILYPFIPTERITSADMERIEQMAGETRVFGYRFVWAKCFVDAMYLDPDPAHAFVALTAGVVSRFPDYPPYEGRYATVVPHLTVARGDEARLRTLQKQLNADARLHEGLEATCRQMVLIEEVAGYWRERMTFRFRDDDIASTAA